MSRAEAMLRKAFGGKHGVLEGIAYEGGPHLRLGVFSISHHTMFDLTPAEYAATWTSHTQEAHS